MALIWAEGFSGERALAPLWKRYALAGARAWDTSLPASERGLALAEQEQAFAAYEAAIAEAEDALKQKAAGGMARTHVLVVGVGRYQNAGIPALTTSVHGAWAFAEWMLTRFLHTERPLGSLEVLLSPAPELGDWRPSPRVAELLGLRADGTETLPVESATFAHVKDAFERWLPRAAGHPRNAAFFYFSGHGLWKAGPLLLPEDTRLVSASQSLENLIDIQQTQRNMFNTQPSIQCFFVDSCQEITPGLLQNLDAAPGTPLHRPSNAAAIPERDAWLYTGSHISRKAYGPEDAAPFFTQELLACLERRGADISRDDGTWSVTTNSLRPALEAASHFRQETEKKPIKFSWQADVGTFTAELCRIQGRPEVFVKLGCLPADAMTQAKLYVKSADVRHERPGARSEEWFVPVAQGECLAGVELAAGGPFRGIEKSFEATPPRREVSLALLRAESEGGS